MKFLICVFFIGLLSTVLAVDVILPNGVRTYNTLGWPNSRDYDGCGYNPLCAGSYRSGLNAYGLNRHLISTFGNNNIGLIGGYGTYGRAIFKGLGYNKFF